MKLSTLYMSILLLYISIDVFCMEDKTSSAYFIQSQAITAQHEKKLIKYLEHLKNSLYTPKNIEQKLAKIQQKAVQIRENMLYNLKAYYNLSDDHPVWKQYINLVHEYKIFYETDKHIASPTIHHDSKIPTDFLIMLKKNITDNDINPKKINLIASKHNYNMYTSVGSYHKNNGDQCISMDTSPFIEVGLGIIKNLSPDGKKGLSLMLAERIRPDWIFHCVNALKKKKNDSKANNFRIDRTNLELLNLALKNQHNAQMIKAFYSQTYFSEYSSVYYYKLLSKIDLLYRTLAIFKARTQFC